MPWSDRLRADTKLYLWPQRLSNNAVSFFLFIYFYVFFTRCPSQAAISSCSSSPWRTSTASWRTASAATVPGAPRTGAAPGTSATLTSRYAWRSTRWRSPPEGRAPLELDLHKFSVEICFLLRPAGRETPIKWTRPGRYWSPSSSRGRWVSFN